jgi:hypothetical protein
MDVTVDHARGHPLVLRRHGHVSARGHRMINRRHRPGRQLRPDLLHQSAELRLHSRVLIQQIRKAALPSPRDRGLDRFEVRPLRGRELLVCLV